MEVLVEETLIELTEVGVRLTLEIKMEELMRSTSQDDSRLRKISNKGSVLRFSIYLDKLSPSSLYKVPNYSTHRTTALTQTLLNHLSSSLTSPEIPSVLTLGP